MKNTSHNPRFELSELLERMKKANVVIWTLAHAMEKTDMTADAFVDTALAMYEYIGDILSEMDACIDNMVIPIEKGA